MASKAEVRQLLPAAVVLLFFFAAVLGTVVHKGFTYDEANHFEYGNSLVFGGRADRQVNSVMPATAINSLAFRAVGSIFAARAATALFSVVTALYLFVWARRLYGLRAGYLALVLYCCCPNIIAHSAFITTDIYAAGALLMALYHYWSFLRQPTAGRFLLSGITLGLAQVAKFTNVALYPLFLLIAAFYYGRTLWSRRAGSVLLLAAALVLISIVVIDAACLFQGIFIPLADFQFRSAPFRALLEHMPALGALPVPVAHSYLRGLDWVLSDSQTGSAIPYLYLLGELRDPAAGRIFEGYYFIVSLFKVPLATLLVLAAACLALLLCPWSYDIRKNEIFLLAPAIFYCWFFNYDMRAQVGIRHFLVIFPLLFVFSAGIARGGRPRTLTGKLLPSALLAYMLLSVGSAYPHMLSYTNELVWNKTRAYKLFADSNLAWGGDEYYLNRYLEEHPRAIFDPQRPTSGTVVVGLNELVGIRYPEPYRWLREHFEPDAVVAGSYLVYNISPAALSAVSDASGHGN